MNVSNNKHEHLDVLVSSHQPEPSTLKNYIIGFTSSVILTMFAYLAVTHQFAGKWVMIIILAILAMTQFIIQLIYFLHINQEFAPRLKLIVLLSMLTVVVILVGGSIWIMNNLNGRMMDTKAMEQYMNSQNSL